MAKKKRKPQMLTDRSADTLSDLAELCGELSLPDDALSGDIRDAADEEADMIYENVMSQVWYDKLEFLYHHGFQLVRLRELIEEAAKGE